MRNSLDREFWLIILTSYEMWEVEAWAEEAENIEKSTNW